MRISNVFFILLLAMMAKEASARYCSSFKINSLKQEIFWDKDEVRSLNKKVQTTAAEKKQKEAVHLRNPKDKTKKSEFTIAAISAMAATSERDIRLITLLPKLKENQIKLAECEKGAKRVPASAPSAKTSKTRSGAQ